MPLHTRTLWQKIGIEYLSLYQNYWFHSIYTVTVYKNPGYIFSRHILVGETRLNCMLIQTYKFKYVSLSTHDRNHSTFLYFIRKTQQTTRLTTSALLRYVRSARSQSQNLLDPFTAHGTACSREYWLVCTKLIKNVEQTRYPVKVTRVYHAKIALLNANEGYRTKWRQKEAVLYLFRWVPNVCIYHFGMWGVKTYTSLQNPVQISESMARWSHYHKLIHGPLSEPCSVHMGISICAEPCGMWNRSTYSVFACPTNISKTQKAM